jgi:hypothetical protein
MPRVTARWTAPCRGWSGQARFPRPPRPRSGHMPVGRRRAHARSHVCGGSSTWPARCGRAIASPPVGRWITRTVLPHRQRSAQARGRGRRTRSLTQSATALPTKVRGSGVRGFGKPQLLRGAETVTSNVTRNEVNRCWHRRGMWLYVREKSQVEGTVRRLTWPFNPRLCECRHLTQLG